MKKSKIHEFYRLNNKVLSKLYAILILNSAFLISTAQTWTQKANLPGAARTNAAGFSIGNKGYFCTGYDGTGWLNDLWEWDQSTNTWTQKLDLPDQQREGMVAFTIGTKAYVGTGRKDTLLFNDFWEWDQPTNTWTQKANFGGSARFEAAGFSIGTKGYIGTGNDGANTNDFWEWNQATNVWTQKAIFPLTPRNSCIGFSINGLGYIGSGYAAGSVYQQICEYNPSSNSWTTAGMTNIFAYNMAAFVIGDSVYYGTGIDDNSVYYTSFSQWDPTNGSLSLTPFGGTVRYNAAAFSIGGCGYIGTGYDSWVTNDLWEICFVPVSVQENDFENAISVYPNPASETLAVECPMTDDGRIEIYSVFGENVYSTSFIIGRQSPVNISFLSSGVYYLKISTGEKSAVKKFVKL